MKREREKGEELIDTDNCTVLPEGGGGVVKGKGARYLVEGR